MLSFVMMLGCAEPFLGPDFNLSNENTSANYELSVPFDREKYRDENESVLHIDISWNGYADALYHATLSLDEEVIMTDEEAMEPLPYPSY